MSDVMTKCESINNDDSEASLSTSVLEAFNRLAQERGILEYELKYTPVSGKGENSYGLVLQVELTPKRTLITFVAVKPFFSILKIAPKNPARRAHMRVADYYQREVFIYEQVFAAYNTLIYDKDTNSLDTVPKMLYYSLDHQDEFIIFEDLTQREFIQNSRVKMPTYNLVFCAFEALAKIHANSFALQAKQPDIFNSFVSQMDDNLFTEDIAPVSIEFGKKYVRRTRTLLLKDETEHAKDSSHTLQPNHRILVQVLQKIEDNFKHVCLEAVNGAACVPFAVICHGDFWNNNIMYKYDLSNKATSAKLIDFQMSRYASPVLDLVHYFFACTEKDLRDVYFQQLLDNYYDTLSSELRNFDLNPEVIYPKSVFARQLCQFGVYGFCMSAFSVPFFISNTTELFDLDEVSQKIDDLNISAQSLQKSTVTAKVDENAEKRRELVEEYELLTERTMPIFKRRMIGNVADLLKYKMVGDLLAL